MLLLRETETGFQDTRNTLLVLKGLVRRMSAMPGSRAIVMVSPGFYLVTDHRADEMDVINSAIRSNVVISSLDARGLYSLTPGGKAETPRRRNVDPNTSRTSKRIMSARPRLPIMDVLEELAGDTGGTFFHDNNDFAAGLKLLATQPEYIYVLGFAPQNLKFDGSYHKLKVALKNDAGLQMQARRGYFERNHLVRPRRRGARKRSRKRSSRAMKCANCRWSLNTQFFKTGESKARLSILARIDAKHLHFRKADGRNNNTLTVMGGVFDRNGKYVAGTKKIVDLKLRDQTLDALPESGITVKTNLDVASGRLHRSAGGERFRRASDVGAERRSGYSVTSGLSRSEFVSMAQPLPSVTAQYPTCLTEPRPEEAVVTIWLRQTTSGPCSRRFLWYR